MLKKVEFYYTQRFLRSSRCKTELLHDVKDAVDIDFREVSNEDFPIAAIYSGEKYGDAPFRREFRFFNGKFWQKMCFDLSNRFLCKFDSHNESMDCNHLYDEVKEKGSLVIVSDNKAEIFDKLEEYAQNYLFCNGVVWEVCSEPVIFEYDNQTCLTLNNRCNDWDNYNVNDINWHNADGYTLDILMPEVFTYGRDDKEIANGVKEYFLKLWPKCYYTDGFAPKLAEKLLPKVVEKVKSVGPKPYIFTDRDVYLAMHEVMNNLEVK